jgi:selenium metabolism protein YedF
MRIVDTKGQFCPAPLIAAKRALNETAAGESFIVLTDNRTSFDNLNRFLKDNKAECNVTESDGIWSLTVTKITTEPVQSKPEEYCDASIAHFQKGNYVVVISSDKMGEGDAELGHLLMTNFIKALKDMDQLPGKIVFYNNGVKLAVKTSPVIEHLIDLEKMGVELILCATCVNHYSLSNELGVGLVSNIYVIAEAMTTAGNIIKP